MRHLLAKDLRLVAPYLWLLAPAHVLWCAQAFLVPELYFWSSLVAALAFTVSLTLIEWHLDADRLLASLPVSRAAIVRARYVAAVGVVALGAVLYVAYGHLLMAVAAERLMPRWPGLPAWASVSGVAAFAAVGYALVVGFLPFHFRFGPGLGGGLFAAVVAVALTIAAGLSRLLGVGGGAAVPPPSDAIRGWVSSLSVFWGAGPAAVALIGGAALAGIASVWLSERFYERRDL